MDRETVLAKCHLHAVLPLFEEIVDYDNQAKNIVADWKGAFQFSCPGGIAEHLEFSDGKVQARRGAAAHPSVALWFFSPKELNKLFTGQGFALPIPIRGLTKPNMLKGFGELSKRLEFYMKTPEEQLDKEHLPFLVKLKLYAAVRALKEVGENDPHVTATTASLPNGVAELRVADGGPAAHIQIANGVLVPFAGRAKNPNAVMEFASYEIANNLFNDKLDAMAALGSGDVKILGQIPLIDNLNVILDRVSEYLS